MLFLFIHIIIHKDINIIQFSIIIIIIIVIVIISIVDCYYIAIIIIIIIIVIVIIVTRGISPSKRLIQTSIK